MTEDIIPHPLWKTTLAFDRALDGDTAQKIGDALEDAAVSVLLHNKDATDGDDWTVSLTTFGPPNAVDIRQRIATADGLSAVLLPDGIQAERLPEKNWLQHVHDNFPPVTAGRFFIYGSHYAGAVPDGLTGLKIDAATAFGSGEHETTKGCLLALAELREKHDVRNVLDMGCGSGILAIAAAKLWPAARITAIDIDPESVIVTERHARMNGVSDHIKAQAGDGYRAPAVAENGSYDLIVANILAGPLIDMAPEADRALVAGGFCVLSGLLARQENDVIAAHTRLGFRLHGTQALGDWRALVLNK